MLVPFVVVARPDDAPPQDRSEAYLIEGFNHVYGDQLSRLPAWSAWTEQLRGLSAFGRGALAGEVNLHEHAAGIKDLAEIYGRLASEASAAGIR